MTHEEKVLSSSITNIAAQTYTSIATVSRTIQKMGFTGIAQLRYKISNNTQIKENKQTSYTMNKVIYKVYNECNETIDSINVADIMKIAEGIKKSNRVFILAEGLASLVAREFELCLQYLGYNVTIVSEQKWILKMNFLVNKDDVVIILTTQCSDRGLLKAAKDVKSKGAVLYSFCCKADTGLEKISDIYIPGHTEVIMEYKGDVNYSRIALSIITRTISEYLSYRE